MAKCTLVKLLTGRPALKFLSCWNAPMALMPIRASFWLSIQKPQSRKGHAGCFGVYPRRRVVSNLESPRETEDHAYFDFHELTAPLEETVTKRTAFGTHWGLVYFFGNNPEKMRDLLKHQESLDFYI